MKPWLVEQWCLAPTADPAFVWPMEDVLSVYQRPYDPARPVVCLDETSRQLLADARPPLPPVDQPAMVPRTSGAANLFLVTEPLRGWQHVSVSDQRTRLDIARCVTSPGASRSWSTSTTRRRSGSCWCWISSLRIHPPRSPPPSPPAEAKRLADKLELHHTPKHGSWLTMAELELSVLQRQCLRQRLPDRAAMDREVRAWAQRRNEAAKRVDWHFTTDDARITLRRLYPALDC